MHIFADGMSQLTFSNNNIRISLVQKAADNETASVGTLIIPASQATQFVNQLAGSLKQLDEQIKAAKEAQSVQ